MAAKSAEKWMDRFVKQYIYGGRGKVSLRGSKGKDRKEKLQLLEDNPQMQRDLEKKFKTRWVPLIADLKLSTAQRYATRMHHLFKAVKPLNKYAKEFENHIKMMDYKMMCDNVQRMFARLKFTRPNILKELVEKIEVNVRPKIFWRFLSAKPRADRNEKFGVPDPARLKKDWNDYVFGKTTNPLTAPMFVFLFEVVEVVTRDNPVLRLQSLQRMLEYSYTGKTETPLIRKRVLTLPLVDNILRRLLSTIRPNIDLSRCPNQLDELIREELDRLRDGNHHNNDISNAGWVESEDEKTHEPSPPPSSVFTTTSDDTLPDGNSSPPQSLGDHLPPPTDFSSQIPPQLLQSSYNSAFGGGGGGWIPDSSGFAPDAALCRALFDQVRQREMEIEWLQAERDRIAARLSNVSDGLPFHHAGPDGFSFYPSFGMPPMMNPGRSFGGGLPMNPGVSMGSDYSGSYSSGSMPGLAGFPNAHGFGNGPGAFGGMQSQTMDLDCEMDPFVQTTRPPNLPRFGSGNGASYDSFFG